MFGLSRTPGRLMRWFRSSQDGVQRARGDVEALLDGVVALHQHLGLDDRNEIF
jgi:hypothetical protein